MVFLQVVINHQESEVMSHAEVKETIVRAIKLAARAHGDDKWGEYPYMVHLALVANEVRSIAPQWPILEAAAWLHDVIEDHPEYTDEIRRDFPEIFPIIRAVSRSEDESYDNFIQRILDSYVSSAIMLKLADMRVNLGNNPRGNLRKRYEKHIVTLEKRVGTMWQ
jgi:(p)ppGpp synthase/HD superfamily hydrolase